MKNIFNFVFLALGAFLLFLKAPDILTHFKFQNQTAPAFSIQTTKGETVDLAHHGKKIAIIFWATWCGPCEVELKRINELVKENKISPSDVLAVDLQEDEKLVKEIILRRGYLFNVAIDKSRILTSLYKVRATPTVVFIDDKRIVNWMSTGMSPTLSYRLTSFLQ
jgi:cytochrome c biogenesis protein CcmG/thiol:disulfide interchange protein DsbE